MKNLVVLKDFKYKELQRSIFLLSKYHSVLSFRLINHLHRQLLHKLIVLKNINSESSVWDFNYSVSLKFFCWSDFNKNITTNICKNINLNIYLRILFSIFYIYRLLKKFMFYTRINIISLNTKNRKYTVLRSPHTDKKSREQFKKTEYKKLISINSFSGFSELLCLLIKKEYITSKIRSRYISSYK